ncbi:MAG: T9SS type A sorting domain-containing protein [Chitinophagaceae bacterium]
MKTIYQKLWMLLIAASISLTVSAQNQVTVTSSGGTSTADYTDLASAFGAINAGTHTGTINVAINQSTTEPNGFADTLYSSGTLNANYTSLKVYPTAVVTVSGNPGAGRGVVELFGADNVTIDGSLNGTGTDRSLTFVNTSTNTLAFTSVIRVCNNMVAGLNSCDNITIKNCILNGNVTGTAGNNSSVTTTSTSAWTSWGISVAYVSSSIIAQTKIVPATAVSQTMAQDATFGGSAAMTCSANNFVATNNKINLVGRGIQFVGNGTYAFVSSNSVTITDNVIGSDTPLSDFTTLPVTNANYSNTVYGIGIMVAGANSVLISRNTIQNIISYTANTLIGINLNGASGSGATSPMGSIVVSKNIIKNIYQNSNTTASTNTAKGIVINCANGSFYSTAPVATDSNIITNVRCFNAGSILGIDVPAVSNTNAGSTVTRNVISTVYGNYNTGTSSGNQVVGIRFASGNGLICANNRVSDLLIAGNVANFGATSTSAGVFGIQNTGVNNAKVYHNSVYLSGALFNATTASRISAAFSITANTITGNDVRNNIFMNKITGGTTSVAHVAISLPAAATVPSSMNLTLNNNAYYCGTTAASQGIAQFGFTAGTTYFNGTNFAGFKTLAATFSSAGNNNSASFSDNSGTSPFTSDLHTSPSGATQLESGGATLTGVTSIATDIDGDARPNGTAPDMGADEFNGTLLDLVAPQISYAAFSSVCDPTGTPSRTVSGVVITDATGIATSGANMPRIYYKKGASSTFSYANSAAGSLSSGNEYNGSWSFVIDYTGLGLANGDSVFYFVTAQDIVATPNIGTYPVGGVLTDVNTLTTAPATPFNYRAATLSGTYNVGPGFTGQGYSTLSAAIKAYNGSCLGGPVVFNLISSSYSTTSDTILANPNASAINTLTIKPTQVNTVVTGNSGSINAVLLLMGADYVTIDGSIGSTANSVCSPSTRASRNLTFTNSFSSSQTTGAVIWLCNTAAGDPATNNKIINCNITGTYNSSFGGVTQVGIGCAGPGTNGAGQLITTNGVNQNWGNGNVNNQYINDSISTCAFGIYTAGANASNKNTGTIISQCVTGKSPNNLYRGGISANFEDGITINGNTINVINVTALNFPNAAFGISLGYGPGNSGILTSQSSGNEVTNATVTKNTIDSLYNSNYPGGTSTTAIGIFLATGATGTSSISNNIIKNYANNASFGNSTDICSGIHINGGAATVNVYHNTIHTANLSAASGGFSTNGATFGFSLANNAPIVRLRNNIISVNAAGYTNRNTAIGLGYALPASNFTSSNNNLYVSAGSGAGTSTGATAIAQTTSLTTTSPVYHTSLFAWQTNSGQDAGSVNVVPAFVSSTDLHLSTSANCSLIGAAAPGLVSDDIDCTTRTLNIIGADEFAASTISIATTSTSVCSGVNTTFTASVVNATSPSYQWKKNGINVGTNNDNYVDASLANNDVITCVLTSSSCSPVSNSITMSVTQTVTPSVSISTASNNICSGNATQFTATATNGGSSPIFTWRKNGSNVGNGSTISFLGGTLNNGDVITCVLTANNSCQTTTTANSNPIQLTVNQSPTITPIKNQNGASITTANICSIGSAGTVRFGSATPSGTWSSSNTNVATVNNQGYVTANNNGTTTITYTLTTASGCQSSASVMVTIAAVTPPATITGVNSVCAGSSITLSNSTPNGVWSTAQTSQATINASTGVVLGKSAGNIIVNYTISNAQGCSAVATKNIVVSAMPAVPTVAYAPGTALTGSNSIFGSGGFCVGKTFTLIGSPNTSGTGSWLASGAASIGATTGIVSINSAGPGTITYTFTNSLGCANSRTLASNGVTCAARMSNINEQLVTNSDFVIYPNPARSFVSLQVEKLIGTGSIILSDLYGKTITTQSLSIGNNMVDISKLSKGMYFVSMITCEGKTTKKLVVE